MVILIMNQLTQMQQGQGGIPGLSNFPSMFGQPPAQSMAGSSFPGRDATRLQPYLRVCNVIEEKRGEIQSLLVNKFDEVFLKQTKLLQDPTKLYDTITDNTIQVVISHINSMFPEKNSRMMGFKLAKDAYMANNPEGAKRLFSANNLKAFNDEYNRQIGDALENSRTTVIPEQSAQPGYSNQPVPNPYNQQPTPSYLQGPPQTEQPGYPYQPVPNQYSQPGYPSQQGPPQTEQQTPSYLQGPPQYNRRINPATEPNINEYGVVPTPNIKKPNNDTPVKQQPNYSLNSVSQTGGAEQDTNLIVIFNKLYGNGSFQKKINKMITTKLGKIIDGPTVEKQLLKNVQSKINELTQAINSQLDKLIKNLNKDSAMNLLMIKALGDDYVQAYFPNKRGKTLEQYINDSILSEIQLAAKDKKKGGRRKTKRRRQTKRRKQSSTKNIA